MMENGKYFCYNGKHFADGQAVISADNRSFKYGDGFFETMKMINGKIQLQHYHFERLFSSLEILKFEQPGYFTALYLSEQIKKISEKNDHAKLSRIRLNIFRGDGGLYDYENNSLNYIIQTWNLNTDISTLNKKGFIIDIYSKAKKTCDDFSHIKSNNYLPCTMAAFWAKTNKFNDAVILNNYNCIADTTIANVFLLKNGKVKTPALSEGCVNGVMRKYVLQFLKKENIPYEETRIQVDEMYEADEVFLTNAIQGIRWVTQCGIYRYKNKFTQYLYNEINKMLLLNK